ncbi:hypothetical protein KIPB_012559, partial [Kipferlia bialata]|eukprot:g12559.t1
MCLMPWGGDDVSLTLDTWVDSAVAGLSVPDVSFTGVYDSSSQCYEVNVELTYDSAAEVRVTGLAGVTLLSDYLALSTQFTTRDAYTRPVLYQPEDNSEGDFLGMSVAVHKNTVLAGSPGSGKGQFLEIINDALTVTQE